MEKLLQQYFSSASPNCSPQIFVALEILHLFSGHIHSSSIHFPLFAGQNIKAIHDFQIKERKKTRENSAEGALYPASCSAAEVQACPTSPEHHS